MRCADPGKRIGISNHDLSLAKFLEAMIPVVTDERPKRPAIMQRLKRMHEQELIAALGEVNERDNPPPTLLRGNNAAPVCYS